MGLRVHRHHHEVLLLLHDYCTTAALPAHLAVPTATSKHDQNDSQAMGACACAAGVPRKAGCDAAGAATKAEAALSSATPPPGSGRRKETHMKNANI